TSNQRIVMFQLFILAILLFNSLVSCSNSANINHINKSQIIGVQLADGQMVNAQISDPEHRTDTTIRNFVQSWAYLTFNWTSSDTAVRPLKTKREIPGNAYASTFAVSPSFRTGYTAELAELIHTATKRYSTVKSGVNITYISQDPVPTGEGEWEVLLVSNWTGIDSTTGKVFDVPFNKKLLIKSIPVAGKQNLIPSKDLTSLQQVIDNMNRYGLQIVSIEDQPT
ncbi:MAG: hypothetical protein AAFN00_15600, partial [Cyanobacteria bacterium J06558_2]